MLVLASAASVASMSGLSGVHVRACMRVYARYTHVRVWADVKMCFRFQIAETAPHNWEGGREADRRRQRKNHKHTHGPPAPWFFVAETSSPPVPLRTLSQAHPDPNCFNACIPVFFPLAVSSWNARDAADRVKGVQGTLSLTILTLSHTQISLSLTLCCR